jgi:hypothetical protein
MIRENQRRSRARHRQYVESLEARLRSYECRGVQATIEMQVAARAIAAENRALRGLLQAHGIKGTDIDNYLHVELDETPSGARSDSAHGPVYDTAGSVTSAGRLSEGSQPDKPSSAYSEPERRPQSMQQQKRTKSPGEQTSHDPRDITDCGCKDQNCGSPSETSSQGRWHALDRARVLGADLRHGATPWETPCQEAALILAQLRGEADPKDVRDDLGCLEGDLCVIRNTELFRIMDNRER